MEVQQPGRCRVSSCPFPVGSHGQHLNLPLIAYDTTHKVLPAREAHRTWVSRNFVWDQSHRPGMEPPTWLTISSLSPAPAELKLRLLALGPHHNHIVDTVYQAGPEAPGKQRSYHAGYSRASRSSPRSRARASPLGHVECEQTKPAECPSTALHSGCLVHGSSLTWLKVERTSWWCVPSRNT